jgi:hypothetical protein
MQMPQREIEIGTETIIAVAVEIVELDLLVPCPWVAPIEGSTEAKCNRNRKHPLTEKGRVLSPLTKMIGLLTLPCSTNNMLTLHRLMLTAKTRSSREKEIFEKL